MCGGGGIPIVSDIGKGIESAGKGVSNAFDKADNWTEAAGEQLAQIDPGPAIGDALADFDREVIQNIDAGTIATAAAVVTQQYYLIPYIAAANTAIEGGRLEDIALSFGTAYIGAEFAPMVAENVGPAVGNKILTSAITGATVGGTTGAITSGVRGKDILEGATKGAVIGGVAGGVGGAVSEGYNLIKNEFGIGSSYTPNLQQDADFIADSAAGLRAQGISESQMTDILRREGVSSMAAADAARLAWSDVGQAGISQNLAASYSANELFRPPPPVQYGIEKTAKDIVSKEITGEILEDIYKPPAIPLTSLVQRRTAPFGTYSGEDTVTGSMDFDSNVNLSEVRPSKYELRKFANPEGKTVTISFRDNEPMAPIPQGYEEVEKIGAAEGGLIDSSNATMVKYSKKPLIAPRKKVTKPKKTASKGLASKK